MKIKINWGTAMVIVMVLFMVFILQFVYRSMVMDKYQHHLVSEDYYKDELYYQQEIDKVYNASKLEENVKVERTGEGMHIKFPGNMDFTKISGVIYFQRPSDERLDFQRDISLSDFIMLIKDDKLIKGKWNVKIDWKSGEDEYLLKESIFY